MSLTGWTRNLISAPKNGKDVLVRMKESPHLIQVMKWNFEVSCWYWNNGFRVDMPIEDQKSGIWHQPPFFIPSEVQEPWIPQPGEKVVYQISDTARGVGTLLQVGDKTGLIETARALKPMHGTLFKKHGSSHLYLLDLEHIWKKYQGPIVSVALDATERAPIKVGDSFAYRTKSTDQKKDTTCCMGRATVEAVANGVVFLHGIYAPEEGSSELIGTSFHFARPESVVRTWPAIGGVINP